MGRRLNMFDYGRLRGRKDPYFLLRHLIYIYSKRLTVGDLGVCNGAGMG